MAHARADPAPAVLGRQRGTFQLDLDGGEGAEPGRDGSPPLEYALRPDVSARCAR